MIKVYQLKALQNNYIVSIPFKGVKVRCEFKDGNIAKGIYARLYTNDPFKQMAIEKCSLYGKSWTLVETVKEPEDDVQPAAQPQKPMVEQPAAMPVAETPAEPEPEKPADQADNQKEFANLAEAIMFVATTYGQQVESAAQARKVLAENGIKAVIHNG